MVKKSAGSGRQKPTKQPQKPTSSASQPGTGVVSSNTTVANSALSVQRQQGILNIFSEAFDNVLSSDTFPTLLQDIKQALFNRDFDTAFGSEDYLETYAARWSPTRALCYANVFIGLKEHFEPVCNSPASPYTGETSTEEKAQGSSVKMLCIGGCAAEHVAFATFLGQQNMKGSLTLLDSAPWLHVSTILQQRLTSPPPISKYASAAAKASNKALLEDDGQLSLGVLQEDALALDTVRLADLLGTGTGSEAPVIVTLMFTLNELYTNGGIGKTTKLLKSLGATLPHGSLLLVLDSPGSYSEAALGKKKKTYPMQWLLNHTLLETDNVGFTWTTLASHNSLWFRLSDDLTYPIQLENMRYQMHLYRIEKSSAENEA
jgi:25S rRNA (uracil2843-N3)-methyltransferase